MQRFLAVALAVVAGTGVDALPAQSAPPAAAQQPTTPPSIEVRGRIVDGKSGAPIPRASVSIRPGGSSIVIAGAIAGPDGGFRVAGLRPGTYSIRVVYIGFSPLVQELVLAPSPAADAGTIRLNAVAVNLDAVTVKEDRAAVTIEPDRSAYRAKDIAPAAANASELLENVPSIQVDLDGKVSLRGNENVVVQINGRPTPMRGTQLASYLKSLPANVVERVEVIPNPSAKYDPDGMAGIINIALKSNVDLGLSGSVTAAVSTIDRYNGNANLGYQSGPFTSFISAGIVADERLASGLNDRERYDPSNALLAVTDQDSRTTLSNRGLNFNATVDYKLSSRDLLSQALVLNQRRGGDASMNAYAELDGSRALLSSYARPRESNIRGWMFDYDVALKRTFQPRTHELTGELRYNRAHDEDFTSLWRQPSTEPSATYLEGQRDDNDAVTKGFTGQLDYLRAFRPRTKLESGYKSTVRWLDRSFVVTKDPLGDGNWVRSDLSNDLAFDETVHALYAQLSQGFGKFDLQAGLRGELASRTFALADTKYPYDYASLFPSGVVLYNVDDMTQLKGSYSRRIRRPGTQELNPFPTFFDVHNLFFGNPDLAPEYTDAYEFGLTKNMPKGTFQLSPFYRRTTNIIRIEIDPDATFEGREVTTVSFRNLATSDSWGTDITGQFRISPRLSGLTNFSVFKLVTDGGSTSSLGSDALSWTARANLTSEVTPTLVVQGNYNYRAPVNIEGGRFEAQQFAGLSIRKKIDGEKTSVMLRVNDPFGTQRFRVRAGDGQIIQVTERIPNARMLFVGFQHNYGRPPKVRQVAPDPVTQGGSVFPPP